MRPLPTLLILLLLALQVRLWFGEGSLAQLQAVRQQIADQQRENSQMQDRNDVLAAEVVALQQGSDKNGLDVIEGLARQELGMVRKDETFFYMPD